jgi:hypothetical protein
MAIGDDFSVNTAGDIRHDSGSTNYTVLELHRWLQDLADDAAGTVNDLLDITVSTPSERSTDNIITLNGAFNIDDTAAQFLYDGSITQASGDTIYSGLVVVGAVETGTELQIWQDEQIVTSHWSTGKNADAAANILNRVLVKVKHLGSPIDGQRIVVWARELSDTYAEFAVTMGLGNNVAAIFTANDLNNQTAAGTIATWSDITNTEGWQSYDISGDGTSEEWYSRWDYGARSASQVYERTKWIQRRGSSEAIHSTTGPLFRGITHEFAFDGQTTSFAEDNIVAWGTTFAFDGGTGTAPAVGDYVENVTDGGFGKIVHVNGATSGVVTIQRFSTTEVWADPGDIQIVMDSSYAAKSGDFDINGTVTGNTNMGGAGRILAEDDDGATGTLWIQLLSGAAPANNYTLRERGSAAVDFGDVNGAATARTVKPEFIGVYTGSSIIGAFGIGVDPTDGKAADLFTPLVGSAVSPPNNQDFTVFGLISGDRVLVTNNSSGAPDFTQRVLSVTLAGAAETAVVVTVAIPVDTPQTGNLRITLDDGRHRLVPYTSWTGSTFTIGSTNFLDPDDATSGNGVMISYIDLATATTEETVTLKYDADRTMFVRVRDGGPSPIKTFETTAVFGSGGGSATAIRTADA